MSNFTDLVQKRRTHYGIGKNTDVSQDQVVDQIKKVVADAPSAFNSQTTRVVVLFDEANTKFWNHIYDVQKDVLEGDMWTMMSGVMEGAKNGLGTVLFFQDKDAVDNGIPAAGARKTYYAQNNAGIVQEHIWLALTELGLGGSLQHFNVGYEQGFDKHTRETLNLPENFEMLAQMPFGSIEDEVAAKEYKDIDEIVQVTNQFNG